MRSKVVRTLALAFLLGCVGLVAAQQPSATTGPVPPGIRRKPPKQKMPPEKSKLEEMLAVALKNNPDIRVAVAKLAEADAELSRTRLQVMQKVVTTYHAIETQKKTIAHQEVKCNRFERLLKGGVGMSEEAAEAKQELALAKAKLEELEAQLPVLLGKAQGIAEYYKPMNDYPGEFRESLGKVVKGTQVNSNISQGEKLRKALQTPVKVDYKDKQLETILSDLSKQVAGVSFRVVKVETCENPIRLHFGEALPLSAVLQALTDEYQCCFYVREYGILASMEAYAPPGALKVEDFLRQKPAEK